MSNILYIGHDDYVPGPYPITFIAGVTSVTFSVIIIDDHLLENTETFNLTIDPFSLPNSVSTDDIDEVRVMIADDDSE